MKKRKSQRGMIYQIMASFTTKQSQPRASLSRCTWKVWVWSEAITNKKCKSRNKMHKWFIQATQKMNKNRQRNFRERKMRRRLCKSITKVVNLRRELTRLQTLCRVRWTRKTCLYFRVAVSPKIPNSTSTTRGKKLGKSRMICKMTTKISSVCSSNRVISCRDSKWLQAFQLATGLWWTILSLSLSKMKPQRLPCFSMQSKLWISTIRRMKVQNTICLRWIAVFGSEKHSKISI